MTKLTIKKYIKDYFSAIKESLDFVDVVQIERIIGEIKNASKTGKKLIIVGNGGSASIASHITIDLINAANIKAINFNEASIITCFSNDYGYKNWISKALECYADNGDVVILISSSGQSENMLVGADKAKSMGAIVVTLSGFSSNNPLRKLGDVNLWVNSDSYNTVEMTHNIWLLSMVDYIIDNSVSAEV